MPVTKRERILMAATRLVGEKGYQATSMNDIGAQASVTGPSLYSYFASKSVRSTLPSTEERMPFGSG
jgi:AcrR family transcriptional regulator